MAKIATLGSALQDIFLIDDQAFTVSAGAADYVKGAF